MNTYYFSPDDRNLGGRGSIIKHMKIHYNRIQKAKSSIPPPEDNRYRSPKLNRSADQFREVLETFRRVQNVRQASVDNSAPGTFNLSLKLSHNRAKTRQARKNEHRKILYHMNQRISDLDSFSQRKKNKFNPFCNPSLFLRYPKHKKM